MTSRVHQRIPALVLLGFASLLAYDPEGTAASNVDAMSEAAAHVVAGELTRAVRDSSSDAGPISEGDWLGIARDGIISINPDLSEAASALLARIVSDDHEIVTIIEGEGAYTAVDGERTPMLPGDFVLTPNWMWHDHGNLGNAPVVWLDGLDIPIVRFLDAGFA